MGRKVSQLDPNSPIAYVRFIVDAIDEDSHHEVGVFQIAAHWVDSDELTDEDRAALRVLGQWFGKELSAPTRLSRSSRPGSLAVGISWFRSDARAHIAQARRIADILSRYGVRVRMITTQRPGYIVYQDEFQITAIPFRKSGK